MKWFEDIDEPIRKTHAERLQAARDDVSSATAWLFDVDFSDESIAAITRLIDAKVTLALLERSS